MNEEEERLAAEYEGDPEYIYCGWDDRCMRCTNYGPMFSMPNDDQILCAECCWEWGWTVGGPDPLEYVRSIR